MYYIMEPRTPLGKSGLRLQMAVGYTESWMLGARFGPGEEPPVPFPLRIAADAAGNVLLDFYQAPAVLMSRRLVEVLRGAQVDNLDTYPAVITDARPGHQATFDSHVAVNIIGTIAAADMKRTTFDARVPERVGSAAIDHLEVDESAARHQLLFRLAESLSAVVVDESIKNAVERAAFDTITFTRPSQWFSI